MKNIKQKTVFLLFASIIVLSCSSDDSSPEQEQNEEKEVTLEGDYVGTWNSSTDMDIVYSDFGISAKFKFANSTNERLSGEFFATTGFNSCCNSGDNDGTMIINLDGDNITSFSFNDIITDCTGTFSGNGSITSKNPFTLQIDFTGNDCDGNHTGQLIFKRINN